MSDGGGAGWRPRTRSASPERFWTWCGSTRRRSRSRRSVAGWRPTWQALGLPVENDGTGRDGVGNLIARLDGGPGLPIALSAHFDTVQPGEGIEPVIEGGIVRSAGDTILGSDDKAGIAAILEALQVIREAGLPHPPLEIVLTWGEERAHLGAAAVDVSRLQLQSLLRAGRRG